MERTFESVLVEQCAPTLVGLKPASLFRYQPGPSDEGRVPLARWNVPGYRRYFPRRSPPGPAA